MAATILDGNQIAAEIKAEVAAEVERLTAKGIRPGLAAVLVGNNPASEVYVRSKVKTTGELGIYGEKITPPESITTEEMVKLVIELNARPDIHGILVQLPLPKQVHAKSVLFALNPSKDVDGFHPFNVGLLSTQSFDGLVPCTPLGCMEILKRSGVQIEGANAVVLGRSDIVGKPMAMLLIGESATVTVAHSKTRDLPDVVRQADIVVAAVGRPELVRGGWIKPGAVVIDVGINRVPAAEEGKTRLVGDVAFDEAAEVASAITPVPGGVGPMTIAMLLRNTVVAAHRRAGLADPEGL